MRQTILSCSIRVWPEGCVKHFTNSKSEHIPVRQAHMARSERLRFGVWLAACSSSGRGKYLQGHGGSEHAGESPDLVPRSTSC